MSFLYNFSLISFIALVVVFFSIGLWFLHRKQKKIVYFPILNILKDIPKSFPRIILKRPPMIPILVLLGLGLLVIFLTLQPYVTSFDKSKEPGKRIHIIVDTSASMQANIDKPRLADTISKLANRISIANSVTLSLSSSLDIYRIEELDLLIEKVKSSDFSREGFKLGKYITRLMRKNSKADQIVLISDGDKYSWGDFDWKALERQVPIRLKSVKSLNNNSNNIYFKNIIAKKSDGFIAKSWDVILARSDSRNSDTFQLKASFEGVDVYKSKVIFQDGQETISISAKIPLANILKDKQNGTLKWEIQYSNLDRNKIIVDDIFYQSVKVQRSNVLLITLPYGELLLEDPSYHVQKTLDVLGFKVRRIDQQVRSNLNTFLDYPVWFVAGGRDGMFDKWCPKNRGELPQIVLTPESLKSSFRELCHCVGYHTDRKLSYNKLPIFCEDVMVREQYIEILRAQGGKQIGGSVGSLNSSLAWSFKNGSTKLLATTLPLKPSRMTGITYSNMPIILKFILDYLGLTSLDGDNGNAISLNNNVPVGESQLKFLELSQLPKLIDLTTADKQIMMDQQKENKNIEPIKQYVIYFALILLLVEAIYYIRKSFFATILVASCILLNSQESCAVTLAKLGRPESVKLSKYLKNEIEGRTSISFDERVNAYSRVDQKALEEPWLWSADINLLKGNSSGFNEDLRLWLRRGGLLVLEGRNTENELSKLTADMEGGSWKVVAPDHEMMVSFHLLNSLPECDGGVWRYFSIDNRMAVLSIPYGFLNSMNTGKPSCVNLDNYREQTVRIFINILMVALTTDYKKDQVHLPEILKRLR